MYYVEFQLLSKIASHRNKANKLTCQDAILTVVDVFYQQLCIHSRCLLHKLTYFNRIEVFALKAQAILSAKFSV